MTPISVPAARLSAAIRAVEAGTSPVAVHVDRMIRLEDHGEIVGQWDKGEIDGATSATASGRRGIGRGVMAMLLG